MPAGAELEGEGTARRGGLVEPRKDGFPIVGMDAVEPARAELLLEGPAGELRPAGIGVVPAAIPG